MNRPRRSGSDRPAPPPETEPPGRDDDPALAPEQEARERDSLERLRETRARRRGARRPPR